MNWEPINWMLLVTILSIAAVCLVAWGQPSTLRRLAVSLLARADALEQSRSAYERSLRSWHKKLHIEVRQARSSSVAIARADGKA